jgi:hypothetical protein
MDHKDMSDEEFEALLQGRGELADLLRAMPQPEPSAELDATILANAQAALQSTASAANDPVIPEGGKPARISFVRRWKIPLAFAASALLALHMIGFQSFPNWANHDAAMSRSEPAAAPATAPTAGLASEMSTAAPAPQAATETPPAAAQAERRKEHDTTRMQERAAIASADEAAKKAKARESENAIPPVAMADPKVMATVKPEPPPAAAASAEQPLATGGLEQAPAKAYSGARAEQSTAARVLAKRETGEAGSAANTTIAAAPAAAAPPYTMRSLPEPAAAAPAGEAKAAAADTAAPVDIRKDPKTWLTRIDKLLKADSKKEALDEWTKFRQAYPTYPVAKELTDRIDTLKK